MGARGAVRLKKPEEIEAMRRAGDAVARIVRTLLADVSPGVTTRELNDRGRELIEQEGAEGLFRGYVNGDAPPFQGDFCISINDEVVHGLPGDRALRNGDLLSLDCGLRLEGWCADHASSVVVGGEQANPAAKRLIDAGWHVLEAGLGAMRPGVRWSTVGRVMEEAAEATGFGIVTEFVGHGIGRELHEAPKAPCYWTGYAGQDFTLTEGLVLAVEPILTMSRGADSGRPGELPGWRTRVRVDPSDGWTVRTTDGSLACHVEHTVAVTGAGADVLTSVVSSGAEA
ncbi:MAG: type I methionyl aminopeptidase [Phycisphaerales bacterium]